MDKPVDCVFCSDDETASHLFFDCVVAKEVWNMVSECFGSKLGTTLEVVCKFWVSQKKNSDINSICA